MYLGKNIISCFKLKKKTKQKTKNSLTLLWRREDVRMQMELPVQRVSSVVGKWQHIFRWLQWT